MSSKNNYVFIIFIILIGVVGLFYSHINSYGGGFYSNIYFLSISFFYIIMYLYYLFQNNTEASIGFLFFSPITILIIQYYFSEYQMFSPFPFFIFPIMIINIKTYVNVSFLKEMKFLILIYLYSFFSILFSISSEGLINKRYIYWLGILTSNLFFIFFVSLVLKPNLEKKFNFKKFIDYPYYFFLFISFFAFIRIFLLAFITQNFDIFGYKRLFAYPTISTSNYTVAVLIIMWLYLIKNKQYLSRNKLVFLNIFMFFNVLLSQSRGAVLSLFILFIIFIIKYLIVGTNNIKSFKKSNLFIWTLLIFFILIFYFNYKDNIDINFFDRILLLFQKDKDINVLSRLNFLYEYLDDYEKGNMVNLLFGKGLGNQNNLVTRPHNIYILFLNQLGLFGLLMLIIFFIYSIYKYKNLAYIIIYILIHSFFEPLLLTIWIDQLLILLFACEFIKNKANW